MNIQQALYTITVEDVQNLSEELGIPFKEEDLDFIQDKIGDFMASTWSDSIVYALQELSGRNNNDS